MRAWRRRRPVGMAVGILLLIAGLAFWFCLPEPLFEAPVSTVLLSRNGELLGAKIAPDEQWRFSKRARVPEKYATALIQFEDGRFYSHPGVDPLAVARALYLNLTHGRVVSGASTLSMQVIRLARRSPERTYLEKLREMILALRLELRFSKDEILALHASHAPFGGNVVGLDAAAWRYFGRSAEHLTWAESALLAVLPNKPALMHPGRNRSRLRATRDALLRRLLEAGEIDEMDLRIALLEPLPERPHALPRLAPHLLDTLELQGGRRAAPFLTTLDLDLQRAISGIVEQHASTLYEQGIHNAAALVVDNESFEVLAYVGNSTYDAASGHGHAVDIVRRPRSTGSVLKPLLFAAMLEQGEILPTTLVPDLPTQYAGYMPENYDRRYRGAVQARRALARSLNVPAVRMLHRHGVDRFYDVLRRMGMSTLHRPPGGYGLSLILGGAEGTLWDLTGMYANMAFIAKSSERRGDIHYRRLKLLQDQAVSTSHPAEIGPGAAYLTLKALSEVMRPGAEHHWDNFGGAQPIAWKTGTSYGLRDGWAIGSTARYTVGVWIGNASGEGRAGLTGVATAGPIMLDIFKRLGASGWFEEPDWDLRLVEVCKNDGYLAAGGCETERQAVPHNSHFAKPSPHHEVVHLDGSSTWRVHSRCEPVTRMVHQSWFVLPAGQEYYYRRHHADYRPLPPYRPDCRALVADTEGTGPISLVYPAPHTRLYIPVDLGELKGSTVFEAAHRDRDSTLFWHLDDRYLGETSTFHRLALDIGPGVHRITVVDEQGNRLARRFEVLGKEEVRH